MTDEPGDAWTLDVDQRLLAAKLSVPGRRPGVVSRSALIGRARDSGSRVVGVTAPAGYGKSTLLTEWARTETRAVAWVSLDQLDDDPISLLTLLASAFAQVSQQDADLVDDMAGRSVSALGRAAPRLAAALRASSVPFVLLLDDLHEIRSEASHDVLGVVLAGIPDGSQVVAASRAEQPHLARMRADGDAIEIGVADLALDADGTGRVFAAAHLPLSQETAVRVVERTEGWPVGVYLASLVARESGGLTLTGNDRYVADYLQRESLRQLPEQSQQFLRRTSVLGDLSAPLCDAVLGSSGSQEQLRSLEASSQFLVALDRHREWFRYHGLFREFLQGELARVEPDLAMKLHLRAADWYEAHGSLGRAIEHLLITTEYDRCAGLVTQSLLPTYMSGQLSTVQRWLRGLGPATVDDHPPLAVLAGWIATLTGEAIEAQRLAVVIDAAEFDLVPMDGSASFHSSRARYRALLCADGPEQMLRDASEAVDEEPEWGVWRDTTLVLAGEAHLLVGDVTSAAAVFADCTEKSLRSANPGTGVVSEAELALLAMDRGEWDRAGTYVERALALIDDHRMEDYATSVIGFAAAARYLLHRADPTGAARELARGMRGRPSLTFVIPHLAVRVRLVMARVSAAMGDVVSARHLVHEIDDVLLRRPLLGTLVGEVERLRLELARGDQRGIAGASPLTPAELRLLPYLQTHLTIREIAERLFVSRNTASSEIGSIYRKLGVSSRSDAVRHAVGMGMLGDT